LAASAALVLALIIRASATAARMWTVRRFTAGIGGDELGHHAAAGAGDVGLHRRAGEPAKPRARPPDGVEFAGIKVRRTGDADERWVCGSVAAWGEDGRLGPHRDFWLTVARVPGTPAEIREVRANAFGRDDFFDRGSAHFRACFAGGEVE
jgi:hypothetical protein